MRSLLGVGRFLSTCAPVLLLISCGGHNLSVSKSIFGAHNFRLVEESQRDHVPETSVGAIFLLSQDEGGRTHLFQKYCTGVQISRKHVLTNAHCMKYKAKDVFVDMHFSKKYVALAGETTKYQAEDLYGEIYLRFHGRTRLDDVPVAARTPNVRVAMVAQDLDYAVLELTSDSSGDNGHVGFSSFAPIAPGAALGVLGFPNAMPLTLSQDCTVLEIKGAELRHDCDTLTGSSGGLVYDLQSGQPLALHRRGPGKNSTEYYQQSGQSEDASAMAARQCREDFKLDPQDDSFSQCIDVRKKNFIFNQAVPFVDIARSLETSSPELYTSVMEAQQPTTWTSRSDLAP